MTEEGADFMDYFLLFLSQGVLGFLLQSIGYALAILAVSKIKINFKIFVPLILIYSVVTFAIRQITLISFGYHTVLIMIAFILIAVVMFKTSVYTTVVAVLLTAVVTLLCEVLNLAALNLFAGHETTTALLEGDGTNHGEVMKALAGVPTNIILIVLMAVFYFIRMRKTTSTEGDGTCDGTAGV